MKAHISDDSDEFWQSLKHDMFQMWFLSATELIHNHRKLLAVEKRHEIPFGRRFLDIILGKTFFRRLKQKSSRRTLFQINKSNKFSIQKVMQIKNSIKGRINIVQEDSLE